MLLLPTGALQAAFVQGQEWLLCQSSLHTGTHFPGSSCLFESSE